MTTKLPIDDEERNLWAQVSRGLFGIIRICQHYANPVGQPGCPTNDLRMAGQRLIELATWCDENKLTDPNQPSYDGVKKCPDAPSPKGPNEA
jgi:hypothetical protein